MDDTQEDGLPQGGSWTGAIHPKAIPGALKVHQDVIGKLQRTLRPELAKLQAEEAILKLLIRRERRRLERRARGRQHAQQRHAQQAQQAQQAREGEQGQAPGEQAGGEMALGNQGGAEPQRQPQQQGLAGEEEQGQRGERQRRELPGPS